MHRIKTKTNRGFHSFALLFAIFFCTNIFNMLIKLMLVNLHVCSWKFASVLFGILWKWKMCTTLCPLFFSVSTSQRHAHPAHIFTAFRLYMCRIRISSMHNKSYAQDQRQTGIKHREKTPPKQQQIIFRESTQLDSLSAYRTTERQGACTFWRVAAATAQPQYRARINFGVRISNEMIRMQFSFVWDDMSVCVCMWARSHAPSVRSSTDMVLPLFVYTITYIIYVVCRLSFQFQVVSSTAVRFFSAWNAKWKWVATQMCSWVCVCVGDFFKFLILQNNAAHT